MSDMGKLHKVIISPDLSGLRLDKALSQLLPLSRSRIQNLIEAQAVKNAGTPCLDASTKVKEGAEYEIHEPAAIAATPQAESISLDITYEDDDLIVINKAAGMVVHPAAGSPSGTLVNALLGHCGESLSGIGGEIRPGIVHRIDKETSGLLVVAKNDKAHQGLAKQFEQHTVMREYSAIVWGVPAKSDPRLAGIEAVTNEGQWWKIDAALDRHPHDRKKQAVSPKGRHAITRFTVAETFGPKEKPVCALIKCRLETGRTHQIRVHLTHIGHALVGDPVYGRSRSISKKAFSLETSKLITSFPRQALHAGVLGFIHPVTGKELLFQSDYPADMAHLLGCLRFEAV